MSDFLKEYLRHPRTVGAVAPSGKGLAKKMTKPVDFARARVIVEYGPGTGAFTKRLFRLKKEETKLILIEQNDVFYEKMRSLCDGKKNTHVLHGSAEEADRLLAELGIAHADVVLSGLPFASLPEKTSIRIFQATKRLIGAEGIFVTFQYTMWKKRFFEKYFRIAKTLFEWRNLPPAFVLVMRTRLTAATEREDG
ncbi:MAG: SAM-dependent methyltransferase [Lachnospiraceae bacterium]|nr:SAM-dependent methyltransferase [Lachnospiraceae bacterium]